MKILFGLLVAVGCYFLLNAYAPTMWATGPQFLTFGTFKVSYAMLIIGGVGVMFLRHKGK